MSNEDNEIAFEEEVVSESEETLEEDLDQPNAKVAAMRRRLDKYLEEKQTKKDFEDLFELYDDYLEN